MSALDELEEIAGSLLDLLPPVPVWVMGQKRRQKGESEMRDVKLRVFVGMGEERRDHVVTLPGDTPVAVAGDAVRRELERRLGTVSFKVTRVGLYPHWDGGRT